VLQQIISKTDGVPLFVEELTKMVLESGLLQEGENRYALSGPLPPLAIPATLHDSLMARLDRFATVKAVVQLRATLGREFSYAVIQAVAPVEEPILQQELTKLLHAELLYQRGFPPQATYLFKHALIQEAAYQSILKSTRQQYHQRIAHLLVDRFPEIVETQPEVIAHHYTEAGLSLQAIPYWQQAGQRAVERSANQEAIVHLTKGLEVLKTLPDTAERAQQKLTILLTLGGPLIATKSYASPAVAETFTRAWVLCQPVGDSAQRFLVLRGLWHWYVQKAELQTASARGEELLALAQHHQDAALLVEAHRAMGSTLLARGEFLPA
jgi:predicted ATPase